MIRVSFLGGVYGSPFEGPLGGCCLGLRRVTLMPLPRFSRPIEERVFLQSALFYLLFSRVSLVNRVQPPVVQLVNRVQPPVVQSVTPKKPELSGVDLLKQHVFKGLEPETLEAVKEVDAQVVSLVAAKTVFVYAFGSLKDEALPSYLKEKTRKEIEALRTKFKGYAPSKELISLFNSQKAFTEGPSSQPSDLAVFNAIKGAASHEMQGSSLLTKDWAAAIYT